MDFVHRIMIKITQVAVLVSSYSCIAACDSIHPTVSADKACQALKTVAAAHHLHESKSPTAQCSYSLGGNNTIDSISVTSTNGDERKQVFPFYGSLSNVQSKTSKYHGYTVINSTIGDLCSQAVNTKKWIIMIVSSSSCDHSILDEVIDHL